MFNYYYRIGYHILQNVMIRNLQNCFFYNIEILWWMSPHSCTTEFRVVSFVIWFRSLFLNNFQFSICSVFSVQCRATWESIAIMSQWMRWCGYSCYIVSSILNATIYKLPTPLTFINCEPFNWANDKFVEFCKIILNK